MKPFAFRETTDLPTYEESLKKSQKYYINELEEVIVKIKGSSLKEHDKKETLKKLVKKLLKEL